MIPTAAHYRAARRIARASRLQGHEGARAIIDDLAIADLAVVAEILAHMTWAEKPVRPRRRPGFAPYSTPELREAHRRYALGDRTPEVVALEREYQAARHRHRRDKRQAASA